MSRTLWLLKVLKAITDSGIIVRLGSCEVLTSDWMWGDRWRTMLWLATIPGVALIVGMQLAAESPRWLGKVSQIGGCP